MDTWWSVSWRDLGGVARGVSFRSWRLSVSMAHELGKRGDLVGRVRVERVQE